MQEYLKRLPKEIQDLICIACDVSFHNKMPIYLVGGFVRDLILGVKNLDLDFSVEGDGIGFAEDFALRLKAKLIRHKRFGTATVILKPHLKIDIATSRKEFYPEPAHLPVVSSGNLKDDLFRRDFTINTMAISINPGDFGRLIDFFGGKSDLRDKFIRILHGLSFIDDPTRILRAIRFEKRYNLRIEEKTLCYLKGAVSLRMLEKVEPQRIRDDLILMLKEERPLREIKRLNSLAGFCFLSPHLKVSQNTFRLIALIEQQISWFKRTYPERRALDTWLMYFMGLTDTLSLNEANALCRRLGLSKGEEKRVLTYKKINHKFVSGIDKANIRPSKIFALLEPLSYEAILLVKARYRSPYVRRNIGDFFKTYNGMRTNTSGHDLHGLNITPGPNFQKILQRVLNSKLDGLVKTKEDELRLIKEFIKRQ